MPELLIAARMRAHERAAMESGQVTGLELMERAGQGAVAAILAEWPEFAAAPRRARVLCGPGNNGGDGFVIARLLKARGWLVDVYLYGDPDRLPPDAATAHNRWRTVGPVRPWPVPGPAQSGAASQDDLIVDALFGTGLTRPLRSDLDIDAILPDRDPHVASDRPRVVAVDLPSGLCADSGRALAGRAFWADLSVTFHSEKPGHHLAEGPAHCGKCVVCDIGLARAPDPGIHLCDAPERSVRDKADPNGRAQHKFSHGHVLVLSGGVGRGGAARLAARGALRIGAGLVTLACPPAAVIENAAQLNAVMLRPIKDGAHLAELLEDPRLNALCLGPGLGTGAREVDLVDAALSARSEEGRPATVLDGDALTLIAQHAELFSALHADCVLTPHAGEFRRLFPDIADRLSAVPGTGPAFSKIDATRAAAKRAGCTVLFKGPDTVVADPDGTATVHSASYARAAPWLATAGAGDVLAGFLAGLLARGHGPHGAAVSAAWLHVSCALAFGPGLIAEDLPDRLPHVLRGL